MEKALKKYYRKIRSWLPCSRRLKHKILFEIRDNIAVYISEHPSADFPAI